MYAEKKTGFISNMWNFPWNQCMLSACHEKKRLYQCGCAEADAGDKKNEAESKAAEEKPDKAKANPGGEEKKIRSGCMYVARWHHPVYMNCRKETASRMP